MRHIITEPYCIIPHSEKNGEPIMEHLGIRLERTAYLAFKKSHGEGMTQMLIFNPEYDIKGLPSEIKQWIEDEGIKIYRDKAVPLDYVRSGQKILI